MVKMTYIHPDDWSEASTDQCDRNTEASRVQTPPGAYATVSLSV